ncbi:MAG: CAP domain-containing protein [Verrucomicrobia bacterium]|jgi:hypothetical protein|nr:CAP domain-containing protein [Verrucomicrobiota bacterium]
MKCLDTRTGLNAPFQPGSTVLLLATLLSLETRLPAQASVEYTGDGTPTTIEEEIRWRVNRGRFDSARENTLRGTSYNDIPATAGPLAPNQSLTLAARHHSEDMARNNVFQHDTILGSTYYNAATQPLPWDRLQAEGYSYSSAAENIAAGYSGAEAAYVGWWNSAGHRVNMFNSSLREIGDGYFFWSSSTYDRYYTMDLGSRNSRTFFTDTLFHDANGNGTYDSGEGISGIAVRLLISASAHTNFDISSTVGSFAIPYQTLTAGATLTVTLSNATAAAATLSIPTDHSTLKTVTLAAGQMLTYGSFSNPGSPINAGFRNVAPASLAPLVPTQLQVASAGPNILLRWSSEADLRYLPQATHDCQVWTNLLASPLNGTGSEMSWQDSGTASGQKLYRLLISRP